MPSLPDKSLTIQAMDRERRRSERQTNSVYASNNMQTQTTTDTAPKPSVITTPSQKDPQDLTQLDVLHPNPNAKSYVTALSEGSTHLQQQQGQINILQSKISQIESTLHQLDSKMDRQLTTTDDKLAAILAIIQNKPANPDMNNSASQISSDSEGAQPSLKPQIEFATNNTVPNIQIPGPATSIMMESDLSIGTAQSQHHSQAPSTITPGPDLKVILTQLSSNSLASKVKNRNSKSGTKRSLTR